MRGKKNKSKGSKIKWKTSPRKKNKPKEVNTGKQITELEDQSRRSNIRIISVPKTEQKEGQKHTMEVYVCKHVEVLEYICENFSEWKDKGFQRKRPTNCLA